MTTRHLGATLFKSRLHQIYKSHVTASMHHGTWGLMQRQFYWPYWRSDSSHHNKPALEGYQLLLSTIQGTQVLFHYIERSTAQLVKHKALNLVDVGSSPMMGVTSYDVLFKRSIYKVPAQYYLTEPALGGCMLLLQFTWSYLQSPCSLLHNDPALGGYTGWSFMSIRQLQVPGCCKHDNLALGGYIIWSIQFLLVIEMNNMDFFKVEVFILKQVLSYHFVLLKTWGLQVIWI